MPRSPISRVVMAAAEALDHRVGWHRLPSVLGIPTLMVIRAKLRDLNLYDPGEYRHPLDEEPVRWARWRSIDGTFNDLDAPRMGSVGSRFGRNIPAASGRPETPPGLLTPDPFEVSRELLAREEFQPARLNVLAAAWIQFEVHDWFDHGPPAPGAPWDPDRPDWPGDGRRVKRTRPPGDAQPGGAFTSDDTHWWDASQIYGRDDRWSAAIRAGGGRLKTPDELIGGLSQLVDPAGSAANLWIGPLALSALFAQEHNAICDALVAGEGRRWSPDELFHTARLVNGALMAKIHLLDWTPAVLNHPAMTRGVRVNWWGALGPITRRYGRIGTGDFWFGIPGSATDHHGVPYCLTEEFVSVYRMHWLMPDEYRFHSVSGRGRPERFRLGELVGPTRVPEALKRIGGIDDVLFSLGLAPAGAPALHNYPAELRNLQRPPDADGHVEPIDLAAIDILRDRERGVPRYNLFRQLFHLPPVRSFTQLTANARWAAEIAEVYDGDIDRVDLQVGMLAETPPRGFAVSDTAFRVFLLMAARRFKSDRFFTSCYNTGFYTRTGMDWIKANDMKSVLVRHFPSLEPGLRGVDNPFFCWPDGER